MTCPFVAAVASGDLERARELAEAPPDPAEPAVIAWLVEQARRSLEARDSPDPELGGSVVTETQTWILLVEVGIIALAALLGFRR